jgi:ketosteroid isomerase-like protein
MSHENVEIAERALDASSSGDADAFADLSTAEVQWKTGLGAIERGEIFSGREVLETHLGRVSSAWDEFRFAAEEFRYRDDGVLVPDRLQGRGPGGGVPVDSPVGASWELGGGKLRRRRADLDHVKASEVAGP